MNEILASVLVGLGVAWGVLNLTLRCVPRQRPELARGDFHHQAGEVVPRLGGLALGIGFVAVVLLGHLFGQTRLLDSREHMAIFFGGLAMLTVGLWDDFKPLGARKKLLLQLIIAHAVWVGGVQITAFKNPLSGQVFDLGAWGLGLTVLWVVATTNLINLIDGIDGLAGGIGLMVIGLLACFGGGEGSAHALMAAGVAGGLVAFLRFNFPPARIYLGDGGAYFVGFLIGVLSIANSQKGTVAAALIAPLVALGLPILDTALAIVRRGLKGLPVFRADRRHIHHRLLKHGFSRRETVMVLYCISLVLGISAFGLMWTQGRWMPVLLGGGFVVVLLLARGARLGLDIMAIGRVVGNSTQMRDRVRYALALSNCLELEAEQGRTLHELWQEFSNLVRKLGFSRVKVVLPDGHWVWECPTHSVFPARPDHVFEFHHQVRMLVQFQADPASLSGLQMEHLSELAAESWFNAVKSWHKTTGAPVRFATASATPAPLASMAEAAGFIGTAEAAVAAVAEVSSEALLARRGGQSRPSVPL